MRVKVAGIWKDSVPSVKVGGVWKQVSSGSVRVAGVWKSFYNLITNNNDPSFTTFDTANLFDNAVITSAIQSDGKILVGGTFTTFNGVTVNRIVRLNTDGTRDTSFATGTGANSTVQTIAIQPDGKILVGGYFTTFNGVTVNRIVRLNSDGTRDTSFATGTGANSTVLTFAIQPDGKILVGGGFTTFNGVTVRHRVRLNTDGTRDTSFTTVISTSSTVRTIAIQSDGKILVGGDFHIFNGVTAVRIVRLNTDGTTDTSFVRTPGANIIPVRTIAIQSDGKILVGGDFTAFNGVTAVRIVRLNANGTVDTSFITGSGANSTVSTIAVQSDGKILVGGGFSSINNIVRSRIARLLP